MNILGIILGFLLTVLTTLAALFIIRMIKPAREIAGLRPPRGEMRAVS